MSLDCHSRPNNLEPIILTLSVCVCLCECVCVCVCGWRVEGVPLYLCECVCSILFVCMSVQRCVVRVSVCVDTGVC